MSCHFLTRINKDRRIHMEGIVRNMMNDKQQYDYAKLNKDLSDRQQIIDEFNRTRYLDRAKAISLVQSLRVEDADVMFATTAAHAAGGVTTWDKATNEQVVGELILQVNVLQAKIAAATIINAL